MAHILAARTGFQLLNPVIAASGVFGYGTEFDGLNVQSLGAIICKGTTRRPRTGNEPVRMVPTAAGMLNAIGLQNIGVEAVIREKAPVWAGWRVPVLVNVSGSTLEEYVEIVRLLDGVAGVAGIELNISCPNVKEGGLAFGVSAAAAARVTAAVRAETSLPLLVKLSPNVTDIRPIAAAVEESGADGISLINTVHGATVDTRSRRPSLASQSGGLSGPAIKPLALYLVSQVAATVHLPVVGIGGIMTADDVLQFLMAGATAVQLGTALLVNPFAWVQVLRDLEEWQRKEGVRDLTEVVGTANAEYKRAGESRLTGT